MYATTTSKKLFCLLTTAFLIGCGGKVDRAAAQKLSDAFIADWIAHSPDAAFDSMEPAFQKMVSRAEFKAQMEKLSQYCGWPKDSELKDIFTGRKIYTDGHTSPTLKFLYAANTDQFAKGQCYFAVEIVPGDQGGVRVTSFGPMRVTSGNPYP